MDELNEMFKMYLNAYEKRMGEYKDLDALYHDDPSIGYERVHRAEMVCSANAEIFAEFVLSNKDVILDMLAKASK